MKNTFVQSRRFRYGGAAVGLTVAIVVVVLLFNAIFSALASKFLWYTDLTSEYLYTLSDAAKEAVSGVDKDVTILFCNDPDNLTKEYTQRLVYETALGLEKANPNIHVKTVNIFRNPTAVTYYKTTSKSNITSTSIIVYSGTEFRLYALRAMFVFNNASDSTPWSYNGEKKLISGILAVTQAESPVAAITVNHGEPFVAQADQARSAELLYLLEDAGYKLEFLDLANQEIPEDARLMVVYDPLDDFLVKDGISDISEIEKLDRFLDKTNALMVFMDPATPVLPNLEEYLEEWGVKFDRYTNQLDVTTGCSIKDADHSITQNGMSVVGAYTSQGLGASIHSDLRTTYPPKVIFPEAMGITYTYELIQYEDQEDSSNNFLYGSYYSNGVSRAIYDVFNSYPSAVEVADGAEVNKATELNPFHLMTITRESVMADNTTEDYSYVLACGSTEFLSRTLLQSNTYGNDDVMLSVLRAVGKELVLVGLNHKPFASTEIENLTTKEANQYTAVLMIVPVVLSLGFGIYVLVRRKYA